MRCNLLKFTSPNNIMHLIERNLANLYDRRTFLSHGLPADHCHDPIVSLTGHTCITILVETAGHRFSEILVVSGWEVTSLEYAVGAGPTVRLGWLQYLLMATHVTNVVLVFDLTPGGTEF